MTHLKIERIDTTRLDIDLKQPITMSFGVVRSINVILVRMRDQDGLEGLGEATVLGGPFWGGESAEAVQATIEAYLKPLLLGTKVQGIGALSQNLTRFVRGNAAARNAVETAALDLIGRRSGRSASEILGGAVRSTIPVAWTLSTGSAEGDIEEGERAYAEQGHRRFKLKIRRSSSNEDVARSIRIIEAFRGRAAVIADVNQGWDEVAANRYLPRLQEAGLEGIEQPLPAGDIDAAARLSQRYGIEIIADEALTARFALPRSGQRLRSASSRTAMADQRLRRPSRRLPRHRGLASMAGRCSKPHWGRSPPRTSTRRSTSCGSVRNCSGRSGSSRTSRANRSSLSMAS